MTINTLLLKRMGLALGLIVAGVLVWLFLRGANPAVDVEDPVMGSVRGEGTKNTGQPAAPLEMPEISEDERRTALSQDRIYGHWVSDSPEFNLVIVPSQNKNKSPDMIEGHTDTRVWKGWFAKEPFNPVRAQLFFSPQAVEMNDSLPPWVRRKIDGTLEWRIDIFAKGPDHHPYLELHWYRGFVEWDDKVRTVKISEDKNPLIFELRYVPSIQVTQNAPVSVRILAAVDRTSTSTSTSSPLASVLQQQKFNVEVATPYGMLSELGRSIPVTFTGTQSNSQATINLEARVLPGEESKRVIYRSPKSITLARCYGGNEYNPPTYSIDWFYSLEAVGDCVKFDGIDGEIVSVAFGEAAYRFQWWKNWMSAALAAHRDEIERRRIIYNAIVLDGAQPDDLRKIAQKKMMMIRNYDALMASDRFTDAHKTAIGDIYLGGKGVGSFLTYAGATYGEKVSPGKGLLSFTEEDFRQLNGRAVRWPSYEKGVYADSFGLLTEIFGMLTLDFEYDDNIGGRAAEAIPTDVDDQLPDKKTDPSLKRDIVWTRRSEQAAVTTAVSSVSAGMINEYSEAFFQQGILVLYDGIAEESGAGFLFIPVDWILENSPAIMQGLEDDKWPQLASPRNHRGQPIDGWGIAASASNFLLNFAVDIDKAAGGFSTMRFMSRQPLGADVAIKGGMPWRTFIANMKSGEKVVTLSQDAGSFAAVLKNGDVFSSTIPPSVSQAARKSMSAQFVPVRLVDDGASSRQVMSEIGPAPPKSGANLASPSTAAPEAPLNLPAKNAVVTGPGQAEMAMPLAAAQGKKLPAPPQKLPSASSINTDYGAGAKPLAPIGSVMPVQAANNTDGIIAANYALARDGFPLQSETVGSAVMQDVLINAAGRNEIAPAAAYYFGHKAPYPDAYLNQYMASRGVQGAAINPARNKTVRLVDARLANETGWTVTARMELGEGYTRQVVIENITVDVNQVPNKVTFFDPKYGTRLEVDASVFDQKLARKSSESVFKATRYTEPEDLTFTNVIKNPVENFVPPVLAPSGGAAAKISKIPVKNETFTYIDASTNTPMRVDLGDFLGQGSTSQAYKHAANNKLVVRINNPFTDKLTLEHIQKAQTLDDMGRQALRSVQNSKNIRTIPLIDTTTLPDGRRVEIVGLAKGESASDILAARGRKSLFGDELKSFDAYQNELRGHNAVKLNQAELIAGKAAYDKVQEGAKFTSDEAKAIARATDDLNKNGYVVLDGHRHNFNLVYEPDGIKVEFVDPGGIVPVNDLNPLTARKVQTEALIRSEADIKSLNRQHVDPDGYWEGERRAIAENIKDDIDFDKLLTGPAYFDWETLPFKPSLGYENPEVARAFAQLTGQ